MKNPRTLKDFENDPRVSSIHQETHDTTDYWIYLNWPYNCDLMDCPSIHEHTLKDCSDVFKSVVLDYEYWIFDTFIPEKPKHLDIKETYQLTLYQVNKDGSPCKHSCKFYFYYRPDSDLLTLAMGDMGCSLKGIEVLSAV